ncbi:MAG TPA: NRDE family protein, partial [Puia sp.]
TASRDEQRERTPALAPEIYRQNGKKLLYPKDTVAGGTWIAIQENGNIMVLLNGALEKHVRQPPYRKSRGLILLDLVSSDSSVTAFNRAGLDQIEPFTAILVEGGNLFSCQWNGSLRSVKKLNSGSPHIWSSVTLYDPAATEKREDWFRAWLTGNPIPSSQDILRFHQETGDGDPRNDLLMNRSDNVFTHSISSVFLAGRLARFHYLDLRAMKTASRTIRFSKAIPVNA